MNYKLFTDKFALHGRVRFILRDVITGEVEITPWKNNLIVTVGKTATLRRMGGIALLANEGQITYGAVGTNTTAPVIANTTLGTELERKAKSFSQVVGTTLTIRCYFDIDEANGVLTEFGWFGEEATAVADSGTMFNHIQITKTKTVAKTLTVEQEISIA